MVRRTFQKFKYFGHLGIFPDPWIAHCMPLDYHGQFQHARYWQSIPGVLLYALLARFNPGSSGIRFLVTYEEGVKISYPLPKREGIR